MTSEFGTINSNGNEYSGSYTSVEWSQGSQKIRLYMQTQGNPILKEKVNTNYSFEVTKEGISKVTPL